MNSIHSDKVVITYGTFDLFHIGHLRLIRRMQDYGSKIIVGVSTDEFNAEKGKKCVIPFEQRMEIVSAISGVSLVIAETSWDQKISDIERFGVHTFVMGSDWRGKFDHLNEFCNVIYLERTDGVSTTQIKESLNKFSSISKTDIINAFDIIERLRNDLI